MTGSTIEALPWDSEFFGAAIGRAVVETGEELEAAAAAGGFDCVYVIIPGADRGLVQRATARGATLVDLRVELSYAGAPPSPSGEARLATAADAGWLDAAARALSSESRFTADPRFDRADVQLMYSLWLERCLVGGTVAVPADGSREGFVAATSADDATRIDLVYVAPEARGRGLGGALLRGALHAAGGTRATVVTQVQNVAAQRLYQSLGFRTASLAAILHVWSRVAPPD